MRPRDLLPLTHTLVLVTLASALTVSCGPRDPEPAPGAAAGQAEPATAAGRPAPDAAASHASPQAAFWARLSEPCGQAFPGRLVVDRPDREPLAGWDDAMVAHWAACDDDRLHIAFHIGRDGGETWDRSRTWVLTRDAAGLELRHDHRRPDGTEDEETWYGGRTVDEGTATAQWFLFDERRAPDGAVLGWRIELVPGERYTYGTIRGDDYTWRVDFDLSRAVAPPPPAWGHGG